MAMWEPPRRLSPCCQACQPPFVLAAPLEYS